MIVRAGIPGAGGGVTGMRVDQPAGGGSHRVLAAPAAHPAGQRVEVAHRRVALRVHDQVHVLGPADNPQLGHALVRRYDDLHTRTPSRYQPLPAVGVAGAARPVDSLVLLGGHRPGQAQSLGAAAPPGQGCLTPGRVVGQRLAGKVVDVVVHRLAVVLDRRVAHHSHPTHRPATSPHYVSHAVGKPPACNRVPLLFAVYIIDFDL